MTYEEAKAIKATIDAKREELAAMICMAFEAGVYDVLLGPIMDAKDFRERQQRQEARARALDACREASAHEEGA